MGALWFNERFTRRSLVTLILLALALVFYLAPSGSAIFGIGIFIAMLGGVFEALSYAVRKADTTLTKESITAAQSIGGLGIGLVFLATQHQTIMHGPLSIISVVIMGILALIYVGIGYLITYGMRHYSLSVGSVILSADLLFALIINAIIIAQVPTVYEIAGSILLFACVGYATYAGREPDASSSRTAVPAEEVSVE